MNAASILLIVVGAVLLGVSLGTTDLAWVYGSIAVTSAGLLVLLAELSAHHRRQ